MNKFRILVTGACGVTSRSVVRSLNQSSVFRDKCEFIGVDICNNEFGIYEGLYKKVYKVPSFDSPNYRSLIQLIIEKHKLEYAIVIPEPEVLYWCEHPFDIKFMRIPPLFAKKVLSKKSLYDNLSDTKLIPAYQVVSKENLLRNKSQIELSYPLWIRDFSEGSTSGKGSFLASSDEKLKAWCTINDTIDNFMLSEFLPGRNLACFLLFHKGKLLKYGIAQRIDYLMGKVAVSGVTGNTCKGKLLNDQSVFQVAYDAVQQILAKTAEVMNGLVVIDLKDDFEGKPKVTEINIRHVAFTSSFAHGGLNFSEYQMLCLIGKEDEISPEQTVQFPESNIILRDVDGLPIYIESYEPLQTGMSYPSE